MKIKNLLPLAGAIFLLLIVISSCQEDITTIGSEILGTETPNGILDESQTVVAYSRKMGPLQSNRLPAYQLGIYNDPVYGKSKVNLLSQLALESNDPKFGDSAVVDSVFVYLPYFSTATTVDSTTTYELDSIYGSTRINLSIFPSNYFLREYDPNSGFEEFQNYYTNQGSTFEEYLGPELASVEDFLPTQNGYIINEGTDTEEKIPPGLRVKLPIEYFQENIIDKEGSPELRNNNNFKNFLRGIYFKVDSPTDDGSLFIFDATKAYVSIFYSFNDENDSSIRDNGIFKLNFSGIKVNTFENQPLPQQIQTAVSNPNIQTGNENLYLRGGDGIMSIVELFGKDSDNNGVADDLETLRDKKWLINEANLIFYVNQDLMVGGDTEPERIIIYDLKNSNVLADYNTDITGGLDAANALTNHYGKLQRGSDENGEYYKLKITAHVSNLINKDSTNVPLGIVVSQNVLTRTTSKLLNPMEPNVQQVPTSSVISPRGTILYGNATPNVEKRLKLQIYYTEPN
ncbi:DUF4270 domain-containing protein [Aequorivita sp. CIP111184]|uniref:DUF4270 domain-containing protein n=1 Tax=Aequorivita sp. CIP111184 TaxID=2211356 RepID=UPI000DBC1402|nr:DUF4270 domain-containing protein [Aequorivita sp. CIP111184]SRX52351.1 hypothetical protein AEQU1_00215 [Aequorivita sp. CIP111184]